MDPRQDKRVACDPEKPIDTRDNLFALIGIGGGGGVPTTTLYCISKSSSLVVIETTVFLPSHTGRQSLPLSSRICLRRGVVPGRFRQRQSSPDSSIFAVRALHRTNAHRRPFSAARPHSRRRDGAFALPLPLLRFRDSATNNTPYVRGFCERIVSQRDGCTEMAHRVPVKPRLLFLLIRHDVTWCRTFTSQHRPFWLPCCRAVQPGVPCRAGLQ